MNNEASGAPVLVHDAQNNEEAEVVRATLEAAGIHAMLSASTTDPVMGGLDQVTSDTWNGGVFVAPEDVEAARAVLAAASPTEQELADEAAGDPMTLEEAEAEVKEA